MQKNSYYHFRGSSSGPYQATEFDGKRLRKAIARKTVDYNTSIVRALETRLYVKDFRERRAFQPDIGYYTQMLPPFSMLDNPINCVTTKFVRISTNKMRCPIFCVLWTPEGRRLVTGASSGEFTLWNGLTFNFETILQAHDAAVRVMEWSHSDSWMVTGDHAGYIKYWQSNMNNVKMYQAHKEPIRALSFCPTDVKLASCSDDGTVRVFDFLTCHEERILRGHGADVKCLHWHPTRSLIASGSKDNQQPVKLWDPRTGQSLITLHAHKNTVMDLKWNQNGNWLLTASRDHLIKVFDVRNLNQELQTFRGHKKEACCLAWHPIHESMFASGGSDGSIMFWQVGIEKEVGCIEQAHDSVVWSIDWHPLGHILASGSNDHTCKFWTRNRPGDKMRDKYNLNLMPKGHEDAEYDEAIGDYDDMDEHGAMIPGLGLSDDYSNHHNESDSKERILNEPTVTAPQRKVPFSKPVPKQFENQWTDNKPSGANKGQSDSNNHSSISNGTMLQASSSSGAVPPMPLPPLPFGLHGGPPPIPPPHIAQQMAMQYSQMDPSMLAQMRPPGYPMMPPPAPHELQMMIQQQQQQAQQQQAQQQQAQQQLMINSNGSSNYSSSSSAPSDYNQNSYARMMHPPPPPSHHQPPPPHHSGQIYPPHYPSNYPGPPPPNYFGPPPTPSSSEMRYRMPMGMNGNGDKSMRRFRHEGPLKKKRRH